MDGIKRRLNRSLEFKISVLNTSIIIGIMLLGGVFSFISSYIDANEIQDNQLRQIATLMNYNNIAVTNGVTPKSTIANNIDSEARLVIQPLTAPFYQHKPDDKMSHWVFPASLANGIQTVTLNHKTWRVFVVKLNNGRRVAIAQNSEWRNEIILNGALRTILPLLVLIPFLVIINILFFRNMFSPINQLATSIDQRSKQDLSQVSHQHVPDEIQPFINAINRLLMRISRSIEMQRRFVADAAHELRSPLTALSLQAEGLASCDLPDDAQSRIRHLQDGLRRSKISLEQLLTFARTQQQTSGDMEKVSIQQIFSLVLEDLLLLAEEKEIDIGVINQSEAYVNANPTELQTVIKNLVDNAIRYTPRKGKIDLDFRLTATQLSIMIEDTGPGIASSEQERVFDPFYRILGNEAIGSGLGLSIVKTIVERMNGSITMKNTELNGVTTGLVITVNFSLT